MIRIKDTETAVKISILKNSTGLYHAKPAQKEISTIADNQTL